MIITKRSQAALRPLLLLLILSVLVQLSPIQFTSSFAAAAAAASTTETTTSTAIEENPNYIPSNQEGDEEEESSSDYDSSDDYDDSDDESDDEDEEEDSKSMINKALSITNKKASKSIEILKKNRTKITIALALFAFRREITDAIIYLTTTKTDDGKRKFIIGRPSPTSIIKIVLFLDFMRKMQDGGSGTGMSTGVGKSQPQSLLGHLVRDLLHPSNAAFIPPVEQHYTFERMNDRFVKDGYAWKKATASSISMPLMASPISKSSRAQILSNGMNSTAQKDDNSTTTVIMEMKVDSSVNSMSTLRDQISYLLHTHRSNMMQETYQEHKEDQNTTNTTANNETLSTLPSSSIEQQLEVVILLESPGGSATDYGLASYQIGRLRKEPGIKVTICVDKVAASGGYMMACMASPGQLFAAPFAVLGSIGVYGQTLNIHNTLQNWGVKPLVFRGGKDKAPVGIVGEITKEGIAKVQSMIDKTHVAFKRHVVKARPILEDGIDAIATGDVWLGQDALEVGLVDRIMASDEYIW
eukprot:CAMPEP_0203678434 /NCGR_PEP_ID=MMETSP0090-20130426/31994_1 /ASSEMBLY_ACC=CAM_ASM_001088 /TAXON_ID=426623 /ORGANISM="Chaetoceros affinis, Strain CCMP159" /LENGTH=526 /DNA_ID=CAMNT_0050545683 /DNA_START=131 /DNA_END=1708 /DNA_ORIENTATION=+